MNALPKTEVEEELKLGSATFAIAIATQSAYIDESSDIDGFYLTAQVRSDATRSVDVSDVRVCLTNGSEREGLWFASGNVTLEPGSNVIALACRSSCVPGCYAVDASQIRLGVDTFPYGNLHSSTATTATAGPVVLPTLVSIPEDGDALDATLDWAPHVFLDRSRTGILTILTGRNSVDKLVLHVKLTSGDIALRGVDETVLEPPPEQQQTSSTTMVAGRDSLTLKGLERHTSYVLRLPFYEASGIADGTLLVSVELDYWSKGANSATPSHLRREVILSLGLPLGVNVQDYFRHDRLLSKFLITAGAAGPLRLASVNLWSEDDGNASTYTIESPRQDPRCILTVADPASFVFAIRKNQQSTHDPARIRLTLVYRTATEEACDYLLRAAEEVCATEPLVTPALRRCLARALSQAAHADISMTKYAQSASLHFRAADKVAWRKTCRQWCGVHSTADVARMFSVVEKIYVGAERLAANEATLDHMDAYAYDDAALELAELQANRRPWRKLSLPVEVPAMMMVNAVSVVLAEDVELRVGVPIDARVEVETSFAWNSIEREPHQQTPADEDDFADAKSDVSDTATPTPVGDDFPTKMICASVDVNCDFVTWLLVGTKRKVITVPAPTTASSLAFSPSMLYKNVICLALVPLQSGHLPLPTISIWPLSEPIAQETPTSHAHRSTTEVGRVQQTTSATSQAAVSSDTFTTNEAEHVHVLPRHKLPPHETFWVSM